MNKSIMRSSSGLAAVAMLLLLITAQPLRAADVPSLFSAEVPYDASRRDGRERAYDAALAQVILRVSGAELVNDVVLFDQLFPEPSAYVTQFRASRDGTMLVTFDGDAIERTLRAANQRVWGGDRPLTLVWLAVDWGQGNREILGAEDADESRSTSRSANRERRLRERILAIAAQRGLPVVFPIMDGEDRAAVSSSDIWGGFDERVRAASDRYNVNSVLIGRVRATGATQQRWTYYFGPDRREWGGEPEVVMGRVSEMLADEFAIGGDEPLRLVDVSIAGIDSVDAYGDVQRKLANMNIIDSFAVVEVAGDRIRLEVRAHGGGSRLARALRFVGLVEQERIEMGELGSSRAPVSSLDFFYEP